MISDKYFKHVIENDFFEMICTDKIGAGINREVWGTINPHVVIKFEEPDSHNNITEYNLWRSACLADNDFQHWLAPCIKISKCGRVLMMRRTTPLEKWNVPKKIPRIFCDIGRRNWGMLKGRAVCHDYGSNYASVHGMTGELKEAQWN